MPPLREYTQEDIDRIMQDNALQTLLEIELLDCKLTSEDDAVAGTKFFKVYVKDISTVASAKMEFDVTIIDKRTGGTAFNQKLKEEAYEDSVKESVDELFDNLAYKIVRGQFFGKKQ